MREQHEWILRDMVAPKWAKSWGGKVSWQRRTWTYGLRIGLQTRISPKLLILGFYHCLISLSVRTKPTTCALKKLNSSKLCPIYYIFSFWIICFWALQSAWKQYPEDTTVLVVGSYLLRNRQGQKFGFGKYIKIFKVLMLPLFNFKSLKYKYKLVFSSFFMRFLQKSRFQPPKYYPY